MTSDHLINTNIVTIIGKIVGEKNLATKSTVRGSYMYYIENIQVE